MTMQSCNHCFSKEEVVIRLFEVGATGPWAQEVHRVRVYEDSCRQDIGNPGTGGRHLPSPGAQNTCVVNWLDSANVTQGHEVRA